MNYKSEGDVSEKKKLIEVALPLEAINAESAREKSIRHGHPSTLHLWWARRPLAAARAVIFSSLVDDPSSHSELFPTEEAQAEERQRLFTLIEKLVKWENSNDPAILAAAKTEIMQSTDNNPPALLDPFAGGGSIPLEAQRLGLKAYASDLNPVAVMINKAMIEIPSMFANISPVNPEALIGSIKNTWGGAKGLAEDVRYYSEWMKQKAFERIGHLYPKVKVPKEQGGSEATVIAWIWARTVKCPNPACGCEMPLVRSFELSKKKGKEAYILPIVENKVISFEVKSGEGVPDGTVTRTGAKCICCNVPVAFEHIRNEAKQNRMGAQLMAIIAEGCNGRLYITPNADHIKAALCTEPSDCPQTALPEKALGFRVQAYGILQHKNLFTNRQLNVLTTFSNLVQEAQKQAEADALAAGMANDSMPLSEKGTGAKAYGQAIGVYLAFIVDRQANYSSTLNAWSGDFIVQTFGRQALPMVWDYAESNPFSNSTGNWSGAIKWVILSLNKLPISGNATVYQFDAQSDIGLRDVLVSTDPPYYDNIGYADLSDYFYIWMRQSLKNTYPKLFKTLLVPKAEELIATPYRFDGSSEKARDFFEYGMLKACKQFYKYVNDNYPTTIYYAFKQSETTTNETGKQTASTGWETMLSAIIQAGFTITGTWPMHTERETGLKAHVNALASSIILVCRKRASNAPVCTRRDFLNALKRELRPALMELQRSNIAPVDLAQSAIGPGMAVYSRYSKVLEASGEPMTIRSALQIINQELDGFFSAQDGDLDRNSRFCVELYTQYAFGEMKFGEADVLARAKNTSVKKLEAADILYAQKSVVRLLTRDELPAKINVSEKITWLLAQQLTHTMETGGIVACAEVIKNNYSSDPEKAKNLAYRLFTIADRNHWAQEAYAYNALIVAWPEIQSKAAQLGGDKPKQTSLSFQ